LGYIWARTLPCQNPACSPEIPFMRETRLAKGQKENCPQAHFQSGSRARRCRNRRAGPPPDRLGPRRGDRAAYRATEAAVEQKRAHLRTEWGIEPLPDEPLPPLKRLRFRVQRHRLTRRGDLFNQRQKLALITLAEKVRQAYRELIGNWPNGN